MLAGAIVVVLVAILESVTSHAGHKLDVPKEVAAAFISSAARFMAPNENKISDRWRGRTSFVS